MAKRLLADIRSLARSHAPNALNVLQGLMNEPTTPAASRIAAAEILLNRGYGKPTTHIAGEGGGPVKIQAIAWLDTLDKSDKAKIIEHQAPAVSKENGQKTLPNGNSSHSIWDNRIDNAAPNSVGVVGVVGVEGAASANTDETPDNPDNQFG